MSWYTIFYLFSLADKISQTMFVISIIASIIGGIAFFVYLIGLIDSNDYKIARKFFWIMFPVMFISWTIWAAVPDRKDMLIIIAGGAVGEFVTNDENAKALPSDITAFLRKEILEATLEEGNSALRDAITGQTELDKLKAKSKEELIQIIQDQKHE